MADCPVSQTTSASGTFDGLDVTLDVTLPTWTDDTLPVDVDITTSGVSPDINIALVIDTSGSTANSSGSDVDGDGDVDSYLEAQQLAAKALFQSYVDAGYDPAAVEITLIEYNTDGATLGTFTLDQQGAFDTAVDDLDAGGLTNFEEGLNEVIDTWAAAGDVDNSDTNAVVFLSDGRRNRGDDGSDERDELLADYGAKVTAIGVGVNSNLTDLNVIDNTGGAEKVDDVADLINVISAPPPLPELQQVEIVIDGVLYDTFTPGDGVLIETPLGFRIDCAEIDGWPYTPGEEINVEVFARFNDGSSVLSGGGVLIPVTICFGHGTLILTMDGYRRIDEINVGDRVLTRDNGFQEVRWIGSTKISAAAMIADPNLAPVRIEADAFGRGMPSANLTVSRQHRVLVEAADAEMLFDSDKVLVPAHALVNGDTVRDAIPEEGVTYFHMVFDDHEVVDAQGLMTESFHPCRATVLGMAPEARKELFTLFPQLETNGMEVAAFEPAYPMLKPFEAKVLVDRLNG